MTTTSTSGRSSRISSPHDPLPIRTSGSSYGWTSVSPRSSRSRSRWTSNSPTCAPRSTTSAPYSRQAAIFEPTALSGMTTVTGTPASRPAHAYACPALPAEIVIAPRFRSAAVSDRIRASAARGLNEPVFWRCSALRYSRPSPSRRPRAAPAIRAAVADDSIGVWWIRPRSSARVSRMAARVTGWSRTIGSMPPRAAAPLPFLDPSPPGKALAFLRN